MDLRPGSSVHGISQVRILEWVAISFSRGYSWPRDRTRVSCIVGRHFTIWATRRLCINLWRCDEEKMRNWVWEFLAHNGGSVNISWSVGKEERSSTLLGSQLGCPVSETKQDAVGLLGIKTFLCPLPWVPKNWFNWLLIRKGRGSRDEQGAVKKKHVTLGQCSGSTSRDMPNIFGLLCGTKVSTKWKMVATWWYTLLSIEGPQFACHLTPDHLWIEEMWALNNSNYHSGICQIVIFLFPSFFLHFLLGILL